MEISKARKAVIIEALPPENRILEQAGADSCIKMPHHINPFSNHETTVYLYRPVHCLCKCCAGAGGLWV